MFFFLLIILNSHILNLLVTCLTSHVLYLIKKQQSDKFFSPTSFFLFSHLSLFKEYNLQKLNFNVNLFRIRTKVSRTLGIEKIKLIWYKQLYFSSYNLKDSFHFWNLIILFWKLAPVEVRMSYISAFQIRIVFSTVVFYVPLNISTHVQ